MARHRGHVGFSLTTKGMLMVQEEEKTMSDISSTYMEEASCYWRLFKFVVVAENQKE